MAVWWVDWKAGRVQLDDDGLVLHRHFRDEVVACQILPNGDFGPSLPWHGQRPTESVEFLRGQVEALQGSIDSPTLSEDRRMVFREEQERSKARLVVAETGVEAMRSDAV